MEDLLGRHDHRHPRMHQENAGSGAHLAHENREVCKVDVEDLVDLSAHTHRPRLGRALQEIVFRHHAGRNRIEASTILSH